LVSAANARHRRSFAALVPSVLRRRTPAIASLAMSGSRDSGNSLRIPPDSCSGAISEFLDNVPVAMSGGGCLWQCAWDSVFYNRLCSGHPNAGLNPSLIEDRSGGALELARKGCGE